MSGVNKVMLIGRLGADPEAKHFDNGNVITNISIATSEKYKDRNGEVVEKTEWHKVVMKGKSAEVVEKHFSKGSQIYVEGKLETRSYDSNGETKYVTEVVCWNFAFIGGKSTNESGVSPELQGQQEPDWLNS